MQVVLLERVENLGNIGDVVSVKPGFARNFLLPREKALRATKANLVRFEAEREVLEARNAKMRDKAKEDGKDIDGKTFVLIRQAGETGILYGSVSARDVADAAGDAVARSMVVLNKPIKALGLHDVRVKLHPEVDITVTVNVARTEDEAERQEKGEDVIQTQMDQDRAEATEAANERAEVAKEMFDEGFDPESTAAPAAEEAPADAPAED